MKRAKLSVEETLERLRTFNERAPAMIEAVKAARNEADNPGEGSPENPAPKP
jgi:hypothetical protein